MINKECETIMFNIEHDHTIEKFVAKEKVSTLLSSTRKGEKIWKNKIQ